MSYLLSVFYLTLFAGTCLTLTYLLHKNFREDNKVDMRERYPKF
jgi:hypothetical protein